MSILMIDLRDLYITTLHSFEEDEQDLLIDKEYGKHFKSFEAFLESFKQVQPKQSLANPIACNGWQCFVVIDNRLHGHICVEGKVAHKYFKCLSKRYNSDRIKLPKYCTQVIPHPDFKFGNIKFISDYITYSQLHRTFNSHITQIIRNRIRKHSPKESASLWLSKKHTFLALDIEWWENVPANILEFGYAICRASYLAGRDDVYWPPIPADNYRRAHYKVRNAGGVNEESKPFIFGKTKTIYKDSVRSVLESVISSLCSPETSTELNDLVIVGHGLQESFKKLKLTIPSNVVMIDIGQLHQILHATMGVYPLRSILDTLQIPYQALCIGNTGNDAMYVLEAYATLCEQHGVARGIRSRSSSGGNLTSSENVSNSTSSTNQSSSAEAIKAKKRVSFSQTAMMGGEESTAVSTPSYFTPFNPMMGYYPPIPPPNSHQPMMSPMSPMSPIPLASPPPMLSPNVVDFRKSAVFRQSNATLRPELKKGDYYQSFEKRKSASYV